MNSSGITDFDNFPLNGIVWANTGAGTFTHAPSSGAYHVLTVKTLTTHGFQIALHYTGTTLYIRTYADSAWGSWRSITLS